MPIMSQRQLQGLLASETDEVYLMCVTISHPSFAEPYRLVYDMNQLVRQSGTFDPFAFQLNLPNQSDDSAPQVTMTVDNIDNKILLSIRNLPAGVRPQLYLEVVTAAEPDTPVVAPNTFQFLSIDFDESSITATVGFDDDFLGTAFPAGTYTPSNSPGLFL